MPPRFTLPKSGVLGGRGAFSPVFDRGMKQAKGPLLAVMAPNELGHHRLGISVPKRVSAKAVVRNRIKRLVRESFRLMQHDLPGGYDIVVVARHHEGVPILADYQRLLSSLLLGLHQKWSDPRTSRRSPDAQPTPHEAGPPSREGA